MKIAIKWDKPLRLRDGAKHDLQFYCPKVDRIPNKPGVYVFVRTYGKTVTPLYVGQSSKLRKRIERHFKGNVGLMTKLQKADNGHRFVFVGRLKLGRGQQEKKVLKIVESAIIKHALTQGHVLFNKQGVKPHVHRITCKGNRFSEKVAPRTMLAERK